MNIGNRAIEHHLRIIRSHSRRLFKQRVAFLHPAMIRQISRQHQNPPNLSGSQLRRSTELLLGRVVLLLLVGNHALRDHAGVGARTGIDQKGGSIIVLGDAGSMTGFMMQRGRMVLCGNVGPGLGDSMYDGTIYVGGKVAALGIDCVPGEWTEADTEFIERKFRIYGLGSPPEFQKFVCGKKLYNYDNLEPSERKLVL